MRIEITQSQGDGFVEVATTHKGESLTWITATYGKIRLEHPERTFDGLNAYWESLSEDAQDKIWAAYKEIKEYLEEVVDLHDIQRHLRAQIKTMYQQMPPDGASRWLMTMGHLHVPVDILEEISPDFRHPKERTYLRDDYVRLATLGLLVKPMIPIWGQFIRQSELANNNDLYKEMEASSLLVDTDLMTWPKPYPAMTKLQNYIEAISENQPVSLGSLWRGLGSSEIPYWVLSKVLVRRLPIIPLNDASVRNNLIRNIHQYAATNLKPGGRGSEIGIGRSGERVMNKEQRFYGPDQDETSILEEYKTKQLVTDGDQSSFQVSSEDIATIVQKVDPSIDLGLLEQTLSVLPLQEKWEIHLHQVLLAQWVLAGGFPPRAFEYISKLAVHRLVAGAQAMLWHWGFISLAMLMQVSELNTNDQGVPGIGRRVGSSSRISNQYRDELMAAFPHVVPQRQRPGQPENHRSGNLAAIAINNITDEINAYDWYYRGPASLRRVSEQPAGSNVLVVERSLKNTLTELAIHLSKLNA